MNQKQVKRQRKLIVLKYEDQTSPISLENNYIIYGAAEDNKHRVQAFKIERRMLVRLVSMGRLNKGVLGVRK